MTTVYTAPSLASDITFDSGHSYRFVTPAMTVASSGQVRCTFPGSPSGSMVASHCSIGVCTNDGTTSADTAATPVELKFGGASGFSTATSVAAVSDWENLSWNIGDHLVVIFDNNGNAGPEYAASQGAQYNTWQTTGTSWNVESPTSGYTQFSGRTIAVSLIETQSGGGATRSPTLTLMGVGP